MAHHIPNRRTLDPDEITALDTVTHRYDTARERARASLLEAHIAYKTAIREAAEARDDQLLAVVEAATTAAPNQGTQARIVEYLGMNPSYLSLRLKRARARHARTDGGSVAPPPEGRRSTVNTTADAEAV